MPAARINLPLALTLSLGLHAGLVALWVATAIPYRTPAAQDLQIRLEVTPPPPENLVHSARQRPARKPKAEKQSPLPDFPPPTGKQPVTMAAPAAPTAEEWALASTYTLKNSKRYRYNWGQQVRSMMGTAVEGVRQGMARIHVEIAPNGKLARVDVLWSTSEYVEKRVLQAIHAMPPLPATPTGKPLTFEKTIAFVPFRRAGRRSTRTTACRTRRHSRIRSRGMAPRSSTRHRPTQVMPSPHATPPRSLSAPTQGRTPSTRKKRTWRASSGNGGRRD